MSDVGLELCVDCLGGDLRAGSIDATLVFDHVGPLCIYHWDKRLKRGEKLDSKNAPDRH